MLAAVRQKIFDERYKESVYSGARFEEDEILEELIGDYNDFYKSSFENFRDTTEGHTLPEGVDYSTLENSLGHLSIDELVAPFPKRRDPLVVSNRIHSFSPISEWEGYVTAISDTTFFANLVNIKDESGLPDDEAEFQLLDLSESERMNLQIGSVVRWVVGFEKLANDMRQRVSRVHVRRLPAHSLKEYEKTLLEEKEF